MGHNHNAADQVNTAVLISNRAKIILASFLGLVAASLLVGMFLLWPNRGAVNKLSAKIPYAAPGVTFETARINRIHDLCKSSLVSRQNDSLTCELAFVTVISGKDKGKETQVQLPRTTSDSALKSNDQIYLMRTDSQGGVLYQFFGVKRTITVMVMLVIFVLTVLVVARWRGLRALIGLGISGVMIYYFMLPALALGKSGVLVGLVCSVAIMYVVVYLTHGFSLRTSAALAGTIIGLVFTASLGIFAVWFGRLSGFMDEDQYQLSVIAGGLNFQGLLIAAIIVGGLGVLNDVTITQASAVYELRQAGAHLSRREIFVSAMRIGRDHIASTIYTIVFAYAGAALAVLLLLYFYDRPVAELLSTEQFGTEILRTLASATGLVLCVPITTAVAVLTLKPAEPAESNSVEAISV